MFCQEKSGYQGREDEGTLPYYSCCRMEVPKTTQSTNPRSAFRTNHNVVENSFEMGYQVPHEDLQKVLRSSNQ